MKRILVTGSSGYIGQNFIKLFGQFYDIVEIDRIIDKSISSITVSKEIVGVEHIIHLAAISGIQACEKDKEQTIEDNIMSIIKISNMSRFSYSIPVTFASSQAAKDGGNTYSFTKMIGEKILTDNCRNVNILRFSNVYGGLNYFTTKTSVVSNFINATRNGVPIFVNGDGTQIRDFIHVDDVCESIHLSIQAGPIGKNTLDIGTGIGVSIYDLGMSIDASSVLFKKNKDIGVKGNIADTKPAHDLLGFKSEKSLRDYIKDIKNGV